MPPESRVRALADHVICPYACAGDANAPRSTQKVESRDVTAPTVHYGRARSEAKDDIPKFSWFDSPYRKMRNVLMDDLDFCSICHWPEPPYLPVQEEVDHVLKEIGCQDGDVSLLRYADLHKFEILTRCITETLRLWPAVPNGSFRKLQHDDEWNGKVPESKRFAPFMFSPRGCIGRNFAQMEMRIIFAHLLHYFDFALHEKYVNAENYFGINRGTLGPKDLLHTSEDRAPLMGLHMHVTRRPVREG
eukprot:GEMP01060914.1.p1 GENE.GEMP01060914.1~~GEMP01060914.1.p1  ORF type:complete len:247 (+),score=53.78 GEMP01060914.1:76-816(+)